jgi:hypothetical protein
LGAGAEAAVRQKKVGDMRTISGLLALAVALSALCAACGTEEITCGEGEPFYPLEEGAWWIYRTIDNSSGETVECRVVGTPAPMEMPLRPGVVAFPVESARDNETGFRWQELTADGSVHRHVDEWFDLENHRTKIIHYCPYEIRVDDGDHTCAGASWTEIWRELDVVVTDPAAADACAQIAVSPDTCARPDPPAGCEYGEPPYDGLTDLTRSWVVVSTEEQFTVDLGTFTALHLRTQDDEDGVKDWWWARGIGKISDKDYDDAEELVYYCLPASGCAEPLPDEATLDPANGCAPL